MERRTTFREEDQVPRTASFLQRRAGSPPVQPPEHYSAGPAYACLGSSKQHRINPGRAMENEDRICMGMVNVGNDEQVLFAGLFDGHGGGGKASSFVCDRIRQTFETVLADPQYEQEYTDLDLSSRIQLAMEKTFSILDVEFYRTVKAEAVKGNVEKKVRTDCCKYFNEDPCVCMNPPIPANEGSTGTVVVITKNHVICANVGDSDAFLAEEEPPAIHLSTPPMESPRDDGTSSPSSNASSTDTTSDLDDEVGHEAKRLRGPTPPVPVSPTIVMKQISVTDTPIPREDNEDYRRIRGVAARNAQSAQQVAGMVTERRTFLEKMPKDGIIRSARGDRYNYVAVAGARSLNMVRAFGNLGNKKFKDDALVEEDSPIIARPHIAVLPRTDSMCAIVVGSDGLWDNVDKNEVGDVIGKHLSLEHYAADERQNANISSQSMPPPPLPSHSHQSLTERSKTCATELLTRAVKSRRKPDDVSVVVIPLSSSLRSFQSASKDFAWL